MTGNAVPPEYMLAAWCIQGLWAVWLAVWIVLAFSAKRIVYRQPFRQRMQFVLLGVCAGATIHFGRFLPGRLPLTPATECAGVALCALGIGWSIWARLALGGNWSGFVTLKENHELIQSGPYRFTRHPIYTGILTAIAGTILALMPTALGLACFLLFVLTFLLKLHQEEALLLRQFPEAYPAYKARVRGAIIPLLL